MDKDRIIKAFQAEIALLKSPPPHLPPLPQPCDPALAALLKSWYEAGYQTGRFQALQEVHNARPGT